MDNKLKKEKVTHHEKFVHLRTNDGELKASIGYLKPDDTGDVTYAIAIVSPSEHFNDITLRVSRNKVRARLQSAVKGPKQKKVKEGEETKIKPRKPVGAKWQTYGKDIAHSHGEHSVYECIRLSDLDKVGKIHQDELVARINSAKVRIKNLA